MPLPYYINRQSLLEHALVRGSTGSGKTARILTPLSEQLIHHAAAKKDSSILVLDLKGDPAFFHGAKLAAKQKGLPFKWFALSRGRSSFAFNPVLQTHFREALSLSQGASLFANSMGLDFGQQYGATYFRDMALLLIRAVLRLEDVTSFADIARYVRKHPDLIDAPPDAKKDSTHLHAILDELAEIEPFNVGPSSPNEFHQMIDMQSLLETPQVVYFYLQSSQYATMSEMISKFAAYMLLTASSTKDVEEKNNVFVMIDEFQRIVSHEMCIFLQQGRAFGVGCMLAQNTVRLRNASGDFTDDIEESTNIKIDLTANSTSQIERLSAESPEVIGHQRSFTSEDFSVMETKQNMLNNNELFSISSKQEMGLIRVRNATGFTQLGGNQVPFKTEFHISQHEYEERMRTPWPSVDDHDGTLLFKGQLDWRNSDKPSKPSQEKKPKKKKRKESPIAERARNAKKKAELEDEI